jgi:mxaJ protein
MTLRHPGRLAACLSMAFSCGVATTPALAQSDAPPRKSFKVCQDPNNLPFSHERRTGLENKLADLFAKDLGLPVEYYNFPNKLAFIRNTLRYKLPGEDFRCDIVLSVPAGFDQVAATQPYYRSTYTLVFPKSGPLAAVKTQQDLLALPPETLKKLRIGLYDHTPAEQWLNKHGLVDQGVPYKLMNADADAYPGQLIDQDLAQGKLDVVIVWGPIGGYYAQQVKQPALAVVPMRSEPGVRFDFAMAMGVRYGEPQWKQQIDGLLVKHRDDIHALLRSYGVPLVDDSGAPLPAR